MSKEAEKGKAQANGSSNGAASGAVVELSDGSDGLSERVWNDEALPTAVDVDAYLARVRLDRAALRRREARARQGQRRR